MTLLDILNRSHPDDVMGISYNVRRYHHKNKNVIAGVTLRFINFKLEFSFQKLIFIDLVYPSHEISHERDSTFKLIVSSPIALVQYKIADVNRVRRRILSNDFLGDQNETNISFNIGFFEKKKLKKMVKKNLQEFRKYQPISLNDNTSGNFVIFQNYLKQNENYYGNCRG
jgi:hypothetical protein